MLALWRWPGAEPPCRSRRPWSLLGTPRPRQTSEAWVSAVRAFLLLVPVRGGGASSQLTVPPLRDIGADASLGPLQKGPLSTLVP